MDFFRIIFRSAGYWDVSVWWRESASVPRIGFGTNYATKYFAAGRRPAIAATCRYLRLLCGVVIQVLSEPTLDLVNLHALALAVVGDLVTLNFAEIKITRLRMREVKSAHARSRPHCERFCDLNSGIPLDVEQTPECALLGMVRAGRISCGGPDAAILFVNQFVGA